MRSEVRRSQLVLAGLFVAVSPLTLLAFNQNWFFSPVGYLDPFNYVGFFHEYLNPDYAPGAYKLARLPWILAGFLVNRVLSPVPAAYFLHGFFLSLTSLALFAGLYLLLRRVALAAVVATMFGFYTHAHGSGGWDYHNTAAGAFYLLAFLMFALPGAVAGARIHLIGAGAMTALAIHANITLVNFVPVLGLVYVRTVQVRTGVLPDWRVVAMRIGWCTVGAVLITVVLGFINVMAGREFLFFALLTRITATYVADSQHVAGWRMAPGWVLTARHLSLVGAVFLAGAVAFVLRRKATSETDRLSLTLILQFLIMALVWVGWQLAGQLALDWVYFAYVLIPSCFIAIGGLLSLRWPEACERHWLAASLGTATACLVCLAGGLSASLSILPSVLTGSIAIVGGAVFAAGFLVFVWRPTAVTSIVMLAVYAFTNALVSDGGYSLFDPCKVRPATYGAILDTALWINALDPTFTRVRTWFDQDEEILLAADCKVSVAAVSGSITQLSFLPYLVEPYPMPGVDHIPQTALDEAANSEAIVAIITDKPAHLESWSARLAQLGIGHQEIARHRSAVAAAGLSVYAWQLTQQPPQSSRFRAPIIAVTDQTPQQLNVYGTPKGEVVSDGDHVVFTLTDVRDHLAWEKALFPPLETETWAEVTIELPASASNALSCRLVVQNPAFNTIAATQCSSGKRYVKIPRGTDGLRIYLTDYTRRAIIVPRRIDVALEDAALNSQRPTPNSQ